MKKSRIPLVLLFMMVDMALRVHCVNDCTFSPDGIKTENVRSFIASEKCPSQTMTTDIIWGSDAINTFNVSISWYVKREQSKCL